MNSPEKALNVIRARSVLLQIARPVQLPEPVLFTQMLIAQEELLNNYFDVE
jgi:hypothetical protein